MTNATHILISSSPDRQNLVNYKAIAVFNDQSFSSMELEVKRVRALWDPSLAIPGTDRRGGWRCPEDTRFGGQITDRFGRNCGWGLTRRLANTITDIGERLEDRDEDRRQRRLDRRNRRMERRLGGGKPDMIERLAGRLADRLERRDSDRSARSIDVSESDLPDVSGPKPPLAPPPRRRRVETLNPNLAPPPRRPRQVVANMPRSSSPISRPRTSQEDSQIIEENRQIANRVQAYLELASDDTELLAARDTYQQIADNTADLLRRGNPDNEDLLRQFDEAMHGVAVADWMLEGAPEGMLPDVERNLFKPPLKRQATAPPQLKNEVLAAVDDRDVAGLIREQVAATYGDATNREKVDEYQSFFENEIQRLADELSQNYTPELSRQYDRAMYGFLYGEWLKGGQQQKFPKVERNVWEDVFGPDQGLRSPRRPDVVNAARFDDESKPTFRERFKGIMGIHRRNMDKQPIRPRPENMGNAADLDENGLSKPKEIENININSREDAIKFVREGGDLNQLPNEYWLSALLANSSSRKNDPGKRFQLVETDNGALGDTMLFIARNREGDADPTGQGWVLKGDYDEQGVMHEVIGWNLAVDHGFMVEGAMFDGYAEREDGRPDRFLNKPYAVIPLALNGMPEGVAPNRQLGRGGTEYDVNAMMDDPDTMAPRLAMALHYYLLGTPDRHDENALAYRNRGGFVFIPIDHGFGGSGEEDPLNYLLPISYGMEYSGPGGGAEWDIFDDVNNSDPHKYGILGNIRSQVEDLRERRPEDAAQRAQEIIATMDEIIERGQAVIDEGRDAWVERLANGAPSYKMAKEAERLWLDYAKRLGKLQAARKTLIAEMGLDQYE